MGKSYPETPETPERAIWELAAAFRKVIRFETRYSRFGGWRVEVEGRMKDFLLLATGLLISKKRSQEGTSICHVI